MSAIGGMHWVLIAGIGLIGGILSGTLGVGSGVFFIPALVYLLAVPQKTAQGMALLVMVPMALTSGIRYLANPAIGIDLKVVLVMVAAAVVGALCGSGVAFALPDVVLRKGFALFIIVTGALMLWK